MSESLLAYQFPSFLGLPLSHGLSGRVTSRPFEGDVGHGRGTTPGEIEENRTAFLNELDIAPDSLTVGRQTHGARVHLAAVDDRGRGRFPAFDGFAETDALITAASELALGVIVADCVPILIYDPEHHAIATIHAGWRGTVAGIAANAVNAMREQFGSRPDALLVGVGPSIGPCCFEVGAEVISRWQESSARQPGQAVRRSDSSYHFDLWEANRQLLVSTGVRHDRIEISQVCVRCEIQRFFSFRAAGQGIAHPGRMLMVAQLRPLP